MELEIERKFLIGDINGIGFDIETYDKKLYKQSYISTDPTIRVRQEADRFFLTVKGDGHMAREEFNLEIDAKQFKRLARKCETGVVSKYRYFVPLGEYTAEVDVYLDELEGLYTAEVEFPTKEEAEAFVPPSWFGEDVTFDSRYKNTRLALRGKPTA